MTQQEIHEHTYGWFGRMILCVDSECMAPVAPEDIPFFQDSSWADAMHYGPTEDYIDFDSVSDFP